MAEQWPTGTVLEATEDIPIDDWDWEGNRTVILQGARATVTGDNLSRPPTEDGFIWFPSDKVRHPAGSTIFQVSGLWHGHRDSFKVVGQVEPRPFA